MDTPLVSICSICYNQEKYIRQALDSFLMQETDFKYEIIIGDDASTDSTADIIREYAEEHPDIFKPILREKNIGAMENFKDVHLRAEGKYIAFCEGDDYWTDSLKLQKQVDYMEAHNTCVLTYTDVDFYYEHDDRLERAVIKSGIIPPSQGFEDHLLGGRYISPLTWLYRRDVFETFNIDTEDKDGTFSIALDFYKSGDIHYIDEVTGFRCIRWGSESHQTDEYKKYIYEKSVYQIKRRYAERYHLDEDKVCGIKWLGLETFAFRAKKFNDENFLNNLWESFPEVRCLLTNTDETLNQTLLALGAVQKRKVLVDKETLMNISYQDWGQYVSSVFENEHNLTDRQMALDDHIQQLESSIVTRSAEVAARDTQIQ